MRDRFHGAQDRPVLLQRLPTTGEVSAREEIEMKDRIAAVKAEAKFHPIDDQRFIFECRKTTHLFTVTWTLRRFYKNREYGYQIDADEFLLNEEPAYRRRVAWKLLYARRQLGHR